MNFEEPKHFLIENIGETGVQLKEVDSFRKSELVGLSDRLSSILIDYGSELIVSGFDNSKVPDLIFRPQITKNRDLAKGDIEVKASINTSFEQVEFFKNNYKSPYERNIILHFSLLEHCNDYIFS